MITPAVPDPPELDHILWTHFGPGDVAFDVGANCGQTLPRISDLYATTVAFEPAEEAFDYLLTQTQFSSQPGIILEKLAVTSHDGFVELMAAPSKIDTGQLVTHGTAGMEWSEDEVVNGVIRTLPAITLDSYAEQHELWPRFIKIDVEGHEWEVLAGAEKVLERRPMMLIEIHSKNLGEHIRISLEENYYLDLIRHPHYTPGSLLWKSHFWYRCFPKPE